MKLNILILIFFSLNVFAGEYQRRSNEEIAKLTNVAIIGTVLKVEDKSNESEYHQIVTVKIDGVLKGNLKAKPLTFVARDGLKANFHRVYKKGDNGIFLFVNHESKFFLTDPILGFSPFMVN